MIFCANQKEAGVATLVQDKIDFRAKNFTTDRVSFIMIKWSIHQITELQNAWNKTWDLQGETDKFTGMRFQHPFLNKW